MNTLAHHVKTIPERSLGDWAEHLGVSRPYLYALMDGSRNPSIGVAVRIARATNGAVPLEAWPNLSAVITAASQERQGAA